MTGAPHHDRRTAALPWLKSSLRRRRILAATLVAGVGLVGMPLVARSAVVPSGFISTQVAMGLVSPTAMAIAPDGRIFVSEQAGRVKIIKNGELLATPFLSVTVNSEGERGLIGVEFDPDFAVNHYVYAFYTATTPTLHNRVSRFTANGDVIVPGSEVPILDLETLDAVFHNSGALHFGADGKLYVAVGENARTASAQSLNDRLGKILRINADGTIPSDNPFYTTATGANRSIWALGLRNPFTFAFQRGTSRMFINDVGFNTWEEVNDGIAGSNYGWPITEGPSNDPRFRAPVHAYMHGDTTMTGCAITGGAFYNPPTVQFPATYVGKYFFGDYCSNSIRRIDPDSPAAATVFATSVGKIVDLDVGSDGTLYSLARTQTSAGGTITAIRYGSTAGPTIGIQPSDLSVAAGEPATFTVSASGTAPLSYQWRRDGTDIPGATSASHTLPSTALSDDGARFSVVVTNSTDSVTSQEATLTVIDSSRPSAEITLPVAGTRFGGGTVIDYAGTGDDRQDGALPPSAFTWEVVFHHEDHTHPFIQPTSGSQSGSFTAPVRGETSTDVFYRIYLTVTDSDGLQRTVFRDIAPNTTTFTLATQPSGLRVTLDGQSFLTPRPVTGVVGMARDVGAPSPQSASGVIWQFGSWSDGGAAVHEIITPATAAAFTATYQAVGTAPTCMGRAATVVGSGTITGTTGPDVIVGSTGPDNIRGFGGDDVICGGWGWDRIIPGAGNDIVDGGLGTDGVSYENASAGVTVSLTTGLATGEGNDTLAALENIFGSPSADHLDGSAGPNSIWGGAGADVVRGLAGNDGLYGQGGNDALDGGADTDTCRQGPGTGAVIACEAT